MGGGGAGQEPAGRSDPSARRSCASSPIITAMHPISTAQHSPHSPSTAQVRRSVPWAARLNTQAPGSRRAGWGGRRGWRRKRARPGRGSQSSPGRAGRCRGAACVRSRAQEGGCRSLTKAPAQLGTAAHLKRCRRLLASPPGRPCRASPLHIWAEAHAPRQVQSQVRAQPRSARLRQRIHQVAEAVAAAAAAAIAAAASTAAAAAAVTATASTAAASAAAADAGQTAGRQAEIAAFGHVQRRDGVSGQALQAGCHRLQDSGQTARAVGRGSITYILLRRQQTAVSPGWRSKLQAKLLARAAAPQPAYLRVQPCGVDHHPGSQLCLLPRVCILHHLQGTEGARVGGD